MFTRTLRRAVLAFVLTATPALACTPDYVVAKGDTLSKIADRQLGSIFKFQQIHDLNRAVIGRNPNRIFAGQSLRIPCEGVATGLIDWSVMPNPETIAQLSGQAGLQILDIRSAKETAKGVIPGSVSIPYAEWRGPKENRGEPPSAERIAELLGTSGVRLDQPIVIVHSKEHPMKTGAAAVIYWILKSSGADQLAILRGGFAGWKAADLPIASDFVRPKPYDAMVHFNWEWRADELTVYGIATGQVEGALLDARPHGVYSKVDKLGQAIATTLPGAMNLPAPPILSALKGEIDIEDGVDTVLSAFRGIEADGAQGDVVTFCHVGELGALNWFYASELAGLQNIKLYPESTKGWLDAGGQLHAGTN